MHLRTITVRAAVALTTLLAATVATTGPAEASIDTDAVRLTDSDVDFGGSLFVLGAPAGFGSVEWDIVSGFYTPRLVGTLHLDGAAGKYGRMHISYWDGGGAHIGTAHSITRYAATNSHYSWSVNLSPANLMQITEVHVCTEISSNGTSFSQVDCTTKYLY
jgi:hypothetical protein